MATEELQDEGPSDDPDAEGYVAWRSLIGQLVATFGPDLNAAPSAPWVPTVFEVKDAIIARDEAYLLIRMWPSNEELWVGGSHHGMYAMNRRPEGGFQVAGDKFILIGSRRLPEAEVIELMTPQLDADGLRELRALLERPRDPVSIEGPCPPPHSVRAPPANAKITFRSQSGSDGHARASDWS